MNTVLVHKDQRFPNDEFEYVQGTVDKKYKTVQLRRLYDGAVVTIKVSSTLADCVPIEDFDSLIFEPGYRQSAQSRQQTMIDAFLRVTRNGGFGIDVRGRLNRVERAMNQNSTLKRRQACGGCGMCTDQIHTVHGWECSCCSKVWPS